ncbi:MAG: Wzz/FepE/Etk N-terminal domain-containing protein, partial [Desulfobacterales bacterium]
MDRRFSNRFSPRDFLQVLFKRKVQILLFFFTTFGAVAIGTFLIQPTYEATSHILVKIGRENLSASTVPSSGNNPVINLNREEQLNSEIEILKSPSIAEEVVKALGPEFLYADLGGQGQGFLSSPAPAGVGARLSPVQAAVLKFEKDLTVEAVKKSNVIRISYKNKDPRVAAAAVNVLAIRYLNRPLGVNRNPESDNFFEEQSRVLEDKLIRAEDRLKDFKAQHDLNSLQEQRSLLLKKDSGLRTDLNRTEDQIVETQNRLEQLRAQFGKVPRTIPQGEKVDHNPYLIGSLQARLVELERKEKELLNKYTAQSRLVQNVKDDIAMVRKKRDTQAKKPHGKSSSGVDTTYQRLLGQLQAQLGKVPRAISQDEEVDHNPYLTNSLQARLVGLELKEKELLNKYTEQGRLVQNVKDDIAMVRKKRDTQAKKPHGKSSS